MMRDSSSLRIPRRSRRRARQIEHPEPIWRIDTRPMAFIALFLAIVFLDPASQPRTHALVIELPQGMPDSMAATRAYITVSISKFGQVSIDGQPTAFADIKISTAQAARTVPTVLFIPDPDTDYNTAALVLNEVVKAGIPPSEICFDQLRRFKDFQRVSFDQVTYLVNDRGVRDGWSAPPDVPASGCEQFFEDYYQDT